MLITLLTRIDKDDFLGLESEEVIGAVNEFGEDVYIVRGVHPSYLGAKYNEELCEWQLERNY